MTVRPSVTTAVSAPGKVLLTGGYLVLDRAYSGTVFALDARIHVIVQQLKQDRGRGSGQLATSPLDTAKEAMAGEGQTPTTDDAVDDHPEESVIVRSPQFLNAVWEYGVRRCEDGGGVKVTQRNNG
jgi:phosphomevalonate kinase